MPPKKKAAEEKKEPPAQDNALNASCEENGYLQYLLKVTTAKADAERRAREHWQAKAEAMSALLEAAVNGSADGQREYKHHSEVVQTEQRERLFQLENKNKELVSELGHMSAEVEKLRTELEIQLEYRAKNEDARTKLQATQAEFESILLRVLEKLGLRPSKATADLLGISLGSANKVQAPTISSLFSTNYADNVFVGE